MKELSVAEQRYQAVLAVISDGLSISQVAEKVGVSRQTLHTWLARYEAEGLDGLGSVPEQPYKRAVVRSILTGGSTKAQLRAQSRASDAIKIARFSFDNSRRDSAQMRTRRWQTTASGMKHRGWRGKAGGQCTRRNSDRSPNPFALCS